MRRLPPYSDIQVCIGFRYYLNPDVWKNNCSLAASKVLGPLFYILLVSRQSFGVPVLREARRVATVMIAVT